MKIWDWAVKRIKYDGGEDYNITNEKTGRSVSMVITDDGLIDVETDTGEYPYTGTDQDAAEEAIKNYLE